jgi:hypothetical protein
VIPADTKGLYYGSTVAGLYLHLHPETSTVGPLDSPPVCGPFKLPACGTVAKHRISGEPICLRCAAAAFRAGWREKLCGTELMEWSLAVGRIEMGLMGETAVDDGE